MTATAGHTTIRKKFAITTNRLSETTFRGGARAPQVTLRSTWGLPRLAYLRHATAPTLSHASAAVTRKVAAGRDAAAVTRKVAAGRDAAAVIRNVAAGRAGGTPVVVNPGWSEAQPGGETISRVASERRFVVEAQIYRQAI